MCGFAGFLGGNLDKNDIESCLRNMSDKIFHRGPNDGGIWIDGQQRIGLAHRRLSIVDLTATGHQPMMSPSNRYVIVFNGEIYNHLDIRKDLEKFSYAPNWKGHSDTETLLAGIDVWGLEITLKKAIGMFSIALWDKQTNILSLARDRLGEKPLYYGWQGEGDAKTFLFGSELKAFKKHTSFEKLIDRRALSQFLRYNYIPAPHSIYRGISKLEPGYILTVSLSEPEPNTFQYWNSIENALAGVKNQFEGGPEEAVDALDILLKDAVGRQMVADVPLGAFLSGGIDSSTVVALMQSQSSLPVKTFTIGYGESKYSETGYAKAVARHLGTDHTELYVTPEQAMQVITKLPTIYCEPFADSSQIPTFLVSQLAKQHVTVSLSGDAGDELFSGYNRYQLTSNLWPTISRMPMLLRSSIAKSIASIPPHVLSRFFSFLPWASIGDKLHKGANVIGSRNLDELYLGMVSSWLEPDSIVIQDLKSAELPIAKPSLLMGLNDVERMMVFDTLSYLPDDILVKVDRAAMSNSLEVRVPFLDHRVFDFAWRVPIEYKLRNMQTKWILRQLLYRYVPPELIDRPKMGFGFPVDIWLRGPLREWAENLLSDVRLRQEGYLNPNLIRKKWNEHLSGKRNWSSQLWSVLMFQVWLEEELK